MLLELTTKNTAVTTKTLLLYFSLLCCAVTLALPLNGQVAEISQDKTEGKMTIFLDCEDCDFSYFRRNLTYVDFVCDPLIADLHIFVTRQRTGSGGRSYRLNFIGKKCVTSLSIKHLFACLGF